MKITPPKTLVISSPNTTEVFSGIVLAKSSTSIFVSTEKKKTTFEVVIEKGDVDFFTIGDVITVSPQTSSVTSIDRKEVAVQKPTQTAKPIKQGCFKHTRNL